MNMTAVTLKDLKKMQNALDTAIDDSWEWSKHSDDGGKRRHQEAESLCQLLRIVNLEISIRKKNRKVKS